MSLLFYLKPGQEMPPSGIPFKKKQVKQMRKINTEGHVTKKRRKEEDDLLLVGVANRMFD